MDTARQQDGDRIPRETKRKKERDTNRVGRWRVREEEIEREIPRGRGQRMGGEKSGGGPGARVAGEGRGFESGAAFREARSALSSREPGERERTCVSGREKRVVLVCVLFLGVLTLACPSFPPKKAGGTKRRKSRKSPIDTLYPSPSPSSFSSPPPHPCLFVLCCSSP